MIVNLDYLKNRYRSEEIDTESYGVFIEMEAFALIRELLVSLAKAQTEIIKLRGEINALTTGEPIYPYPAYDIPGDSFYITELIRDLYERIFSEPLDF